MLSNLEKQVFDQWILDLPMTHQLFLRQTHLALPLPYFHDCHFWSIHHAYYGIIPNILKVTSTQAQQRFYLRKLVTNPCGTESILAWRHPFGNSDSAWLSTLVNVYVSGNT
jgi:hypothetical protein